MMFGTEARRMLMLRLIGVAVLALAAVVAHALFGGVRTGEIVAADLLLAMILFAAASAGSALLLLGSHLFDRVEVSARWARSRPTGHVGRRSERARGEAGMKLLRELAATPSPTPDQAARIWITGGRDLRPRAEELRF